MTVCHATGGSTTWATPDDFIAGVKGIYGPIALDCAALATTSKGADYYGPDHPDPSYRDALAIEWLSPGLRWLNPPYGRGPNGTAAWMAKAMVEGQRAGCGPLLCLIPSRTGTVWWHTYVVGAAHAVWFVSKRLAFVEGGRQGDTAGFPSALVEYRPGYPSRGHPPVGTLSRSGQVEHYPAGWGAPQRKQLSLWGDAEVEPWDHYEGAM